MSKGGRDDTSAYSTPFAQAAQSPASNSGGILSSIFGGGTPSSAIASPIAGGSQVAQTVDPIIAAGQNYSSLRDPTGPLARAGWIGSLFATGPSAQEHQAALMQEQANMLGKSRAEAFKTLSTFVQQGQTPQKAFLSFLNTPQGVEFVTKDPNPTEAVQQFMKIATTPADPTADAISAAFGQGGNASQGGQALVGAAPIAASVPTIPPTGMPASPVGAVTSGGPLGSTAPAGSPDAAGIDQTALLSKALAGDPAAGGAAAPLGGPTSGTTAAPAAFKPVTSGTGQDNPNDVNDVTKSAHWMEVARKLATVVPRKDAEGKIDSRANEAAAKALEIAKQLYAQEQGKTTPDIVEYNAVLKQNNANGVSTPSLAEWLLSQKKAGATNIDLNTTEGQDAMSFKTRSSMDSLDYEKNYAPKAQSARDMLSTLQAVSQYADAPSGFAGVAASELAKWSDVLGIEVTPQMKTAQIMQALTAKMSAAFRPVGTGSTSDYEQKLFQSAVPGLMQTPDARKSMMLVAKKFAQRSIDEANLLRDNAGSKDLTAKRDALAAKPVLDDTDIKMLEKYAGGGSGAAAPYVPKNGDTVVNKEGKTLTFQDGVGWR